MSDPLPPIVPPGSCELPPSEAVQWGDIEGILSEQLDLQAALDGKAPVVHGHPISDITGLQAELDSKSVPGHTHTASEITDLQTLLDDKAPLNHTHVSADITDATTTPTNGQIPLYGTSEELTATLFDVPGSASYGGSGFAYFNPSILGTLTVVINGTMSGDRVINWPDGDGFLALTPNFDGTIGISGVTGLQTALDGKVSLTGNQNVAGDKTLTGQTEMPNQALLTDNSAVTKGLMLLSRLPFMSPAAKNIRHRMEFFAGTSLTSGDIGEWGWFSSIPAGASVAQALSNFAFCPSGRGIQLSTGATVSSNVRLYLSQNQSDIWNTIATTFHLSTFNNVNAASAINNSVVWAGYSDQLVGSNQVLFFGWDRTVGPNFMIKWFNGAPQFFDTGINSVIATSGNLQISFTIIGDAFDSGVARVILSINEIFAPIPTVHTINIPAGAVAANVFNHHYSFNVMNTTATNKVIVASGMEIFHPSPHGAH